MNVYKQYRGADPLQANYHTTMMMMAMSDGDPNKSNPNDLMSGSSTLYIDPAPPSLSKDSIFDSYWASSALQEQNIKAFAPTRRELPMFEFPSNLGLPNIVDTSQWDLSLDNMPSIAPSSLPSLDLGSGTTSTTTPTVNTSTPTTSTTGVPPPPSTSGSVPPPPTSGSVPPPPSTGSIPPPPSGSVPPPPTGGIPPPPTGVPPPPGITAVPIVTPPSTSSGEDSGGAEDSGNSGSGDGRSDLLASIRNFSKNKLKNATKHREKETSKGEDVAPKSSGGGGGGDMMSDLFRKISLRRNAIEGTKDDKPKRKKDKSANIEAIPPPTTSTPPTNADSSATTELPKIEPIPTPKRPPEDDSDGSDTDSW